MLRRVHWTRRLSVRLTVLISVVTLATIGGLAVISLRNQEAHILSEAERGATMLTSTVSRSIDQHMMADRRDDAYMVMESISEQPDIRALRLFNDDAVVTFSTRREEIGDDASYRASACTMCHASITSQRACPAESHQVFRRPDGERLLAVVRPIRNEARCASASCHVHPQERPVLGSINLVLSLDEMDRSIAVLRRYMVSLSLAAVVVLAALVVFFFRRAVIAPIKELVRGTVRVSEHDLGQEIAVHSRDELGILARSFNEMTASLRESTRQLEKLMAELERKVEERTRDLRLAQDQLVQSEKMSSLGTLAASIAHEINNPLMGILTSAKLLIRIAGESPDAEKVHALQLKQLRMVQRETERCSAIVRNLLDFSRQRPLEPRPIDLNAPIAEALSICANQMSLQGITLDKALQPELWVLGDVGQLRQAFLNLALNACEAMSQGGTLRVHAARDAQDVVVEIADTGPGIPKENLSKIFDPFFTTKPKGTGLGLSVVYGIIQKHHGRVEVDSQQGVGTQLRVRLPSVQPSSEARS